MPGVVGLGGLSGVSAATCRTTDPKLLAAYRSLATVVSRLTELAKWLESHPQREDLYAAPGHRSRNVHDRIEPSWMR